MVVAPGIFVGSSLGLRCWAELASGTASKSMESTEQIEDFMVAFILARSFLFGCVGVS